MRKLILLIAIVFLLVPNILAYSWNTGSELAYFTMDSSDLTGSDTINDYDGRAYTAQENNGAICGSGTGYIGETCSFDGNDDEAYTNIPPSYLDDTDSFTILGWFYFDDQTASGNDGLWGNLDASNNGVAANRQNGDDNLRLWTGAHEDTGYNLINNTWHFIVITYDGSGNFEIYINDTSIHNASGKSWTNSVEDLTIGDMYNSNDNANMAGKVDEFSFYSEVLPLTTISDIYNQYLGSSQLVTNATTPVTSNNITINNPTNETYAYGQPLTVQITKAISGVCKYSENSSFNFSNDGIIMTGTGLSSTFNINTTLTNYSYYYKCNQSNGTITASAHHFFKGKDKNWNNTFVGLGDSIIKALAGGEMDNQTRFTRTVTEYFNATPYNWFSFIDDNNGEAGACMVDYGGCPSATATINRYKSDLIDLNPRYAYLLPNINDNRYTVPVLNYSETAKTVIDDIIIKATNTTLITSTVIGHRNYTGYTWSQELSAGYNAGLREAAILNEVPFIELHYIMNHNTSLLVDELHLNLIGNNLINNTLIDVIKNSNDYVMTKDRFNIYHDCDAPISVLNYTISISYGQCAGQPSDDWVILLNVTNNSIFVNRADKGFKLNITQQYTPNQTYHIRFNNGTATTQTITANANGDLLNIDIGAGYDFEITIETTIELNVYVNDTNTGNYLQNFTATADTDTNTANNTNYTTLYVTPNNNHTVSASLVGYTILDQVVEITTTPKNVTLQASSSGTTVYIYDESTNALITNTTITLQLIGNSTGTFTTGTGTKTISGLPTGNYTLVYEANGYASRSRPYSLNATGIFNLTLFLLNDGAANIVYANVYSETGQQLPNYYVYTYRTIDGVYEIVEVSRTNYQGQTDLKGELNTPLYYWRVYDDALNLVQTTDPTEIYSTSLDFYILTSSVVGETFKKQNDIIHSGITFNNVTNVFNFSYVDTSNSVSAVELRIYEMPQRTLLTSVNSSSTSDTLTINITGNYTNGTTYLAQVYTSFSPASYLDSLSYTYPAGMPDLSGNGLILTVLIMVVFVFVGIWSPPVAAILMGLSFILTGVLGLHNFAWYIQVSILAICFMFAYLTREYT